MGIDLDQLLRPDRTAVITSEVQNGVVGPHSALPELAEAARVTALPAIARLVAGARAAGVQVIHGIVYRRADGKGANSNARLFRSVQQSPVQLLPGSPETEVVAEVGVDPQDLVLARTHGLNPMAGTDLDPILRNLGLSSLVVVGVSVNVAVPNLVMDAVNRGYQVVLPRDGVCGIPADYADAVIDHSLRLLATVTTVDDVLARWR